MCGFIVTNLPNPDLESANFYVRHRGPDGTNTVEFHGLTFLHNLLSITGNLKFQPFVEGGMACLFNGEIYNYQQFGHFESDGECLIPAFKQHGKYFVNQLDGEFAILVYDAGQRVLRLYTDVFATKPIHYAIDENKFAVASYASAIRSLGFENPKKIAANTLMEISTDDGSYQIESDLFKFNLDQYKNDFDDWNAAFSKSIAKRTRHTREKIFIGLSSGYDSGGIACELNVQDVDYKSYSLFGIEDRKILQQRLRIVARHAHSEIIPISMKDFQEAATYIKDHIEETRLYIYSEGTGHVEEPYLYEDSGAVGLVMICRRAKAEGRKIYLSGQGSDEIFSDYGFAGERFYLHSNFGGLFPEELVKIFPWASFYGSTQESYLRKDEYIAGSFGIETRYPYLDKFVVQEFLNLSPKLKNCCYKSVLRNYLGNHRFPTVFDKKMGFVPINLNGPIIATTLDEILAQDDQLFINSAYQTLLGRDPDEEGLNYYLGRLRTDVPKIKILGELRRSEEGKAYEADLPWLDAAIRHDRWARRAIIGRLVRLFVRVNKSSTERKLRGL